MGKGDLKNSWEIGLAAECPGSHLWWPPAGHQLLPSAQLGPSLEALECDPGH